MRAGVVVVLLVCVACGDKKTTAAASVDAGLAPLTVVATCAEVNGEAQVRRAGKPYWEPLTAGGTLRDGDWVRTLSAASARLEFLKGGSLALSENAVVVVELPTEVETPKGIAVAPRVSVESGEVQAVPSPSDDALAPLPLLIRTPDGKTTVLQATKGAGQTTFRLNASDAGYSVAVLKGAATVKSGDTSVALAAGSATTFGSEGPVAAVELPEYPASLAPGIDARLVFEEGVTATRLLWTPVDAAAGYRVQIARDLSFTIGARTFDVTAGNFVLRPDSKGLYIWRVASRLPSGLVGEYGFARRIFFEGEEPRELLLGPEDGEVVTFSGPLPTVAFTWQAAAQSPTYRLMVSKGQDPQGEPVVNLVTTQQHAEVVTLSAGEYRWGVYVDGKVQKPLFLKPRKLVVKAVPRAVVKTPKTINKWE